MGMGNLENVLQGLRRRPALLRRAVLRLDAAAPRRRPTRSSRRFGDDSSNYYWKLCAAMEIMRLARTTRTGWPARALQTADDSARALLLDGAPQGELRTLPTRRPTRR